MQQGRGQHLCAYTKYRHENPSVKYQMLAGLQNGDNIVINVSAGIIAANFLHISADFEMRKAKESKSILAGTLTAKVVLD